MTSPPRSRLLHAVAVSACLALAGLVGASPAVAATKTCKAGNTNYPNSNPGGYFTSLKVTNVRCSSGAKLMVAYYKCRRKNGQGIEGKCKQSTVNSLRCTESRPSSARVPGQEFNARVTCKSGSKKIVHTYQQNLG